MPIICEEGEVAWAAFHDLSNRRTSNGFGPNPIQTSEIVAWLDLQGIDDADDRRMNYHLIGVLDSEWIRYVIENAPKPGGKGQGHGNR